jgi:hypothetical protein
VLPLTDAERALITSGNIEIGAGLELLDESNRLVEDTSGDLAKYVRDEETGELVDGQIDYDNFTTVHGSCRLSITRRLRWGRDRVRPYMVISDGASSLRVNLGVYILTTPSEKRGEEPQTFEVTGYNLLHLLQSGPGDTYVATAGTTYLQAVRDVLTAAGLSVPLLIDGTLQDTTLPADRVWALTDEGPTWIGIIDDLLDEINYTNLWCDRDGTYRSSPYRDASERPSEHTFDTSDEGTNIVHEDREITEDVASAYNWWKIYRTNLDGKPVDGAGIYFPPQNADPANPEATALGRIVRRVVGVEAADQDALVAQGDRIVAEDTQVTRSIRLRIDPMPALGHADVVTLVDGGVTEKLQVSSWSLSLTGDPGELVLGGLPKPTPERRETQVKATVTQASPLRVVVDGAETDSPANALDGATYALDARVTVTLRNPQPPLVQGIET